MDYNFSYTSAIAQKVGIEANDDTQSFTDGIYNNSLQWKNSSNVWKNWTSSDVTNGDNNTLGWTSTYTSNRATFNN